MAGLRPCGDGSAEAWAIFAEAARPHMLDMVRTIQVVLHMTPYDPVRMRVRRGFTAGNKLARALGFKPYYVSPSFIHYRRTNGRPST